MRAAAALPDSRWREEELMFFSSWSHMLTRETHVVSLVTVQLPFFLGTSKKKIKESFRPNLGKCYCWTGT